MSQIVPKDQAEKLALNFKPKKIRLEPGEEAKSFVEGNGNESNDFAVSPIVAEASGIAELRRKELEDKVEEQVLERVKEIQEDAYSRAYELGQKEGAEKAFNEERDRLHERLSKFDEIVAEFENVRSKILAENEAILIRLSFEIARKIAWREIKADQEPLIQMLNQLIDGIKKDDQVVIRLSDEDFKFIENLRDSGAPEVEDLERVKIVASENIETGGCILESNYGSIDASIPERVNRTWEAIDRKRPNLKGHTTEVTEPIENGKEDKGEGDDDGSDSQSE